MKKFLVVYQMRATVDAESRQEARLKADAMMASIPPEEMACVIDEIKSNKVVIEVSGGVAECTEKPIWAEVEIIDHDNKKAG